MVEVATLRPGIALEIAGVPVPVALLGALVRSDALAARVGLQALKRAVGIMKGTNNLVRLVVGYARFIQIPLLVTAEAAGAPGKSLDQLPDKAPPLGDFGKRAVQILSFPGGTTSFIFVLALFIDLLKIIIALISRVARADRSWGLILLSHWLLLSHHRALTPLAQVLLYLGLDRVVL